MDNDNRTYRSRSSASHSEGSQRQSRSSSRSQAQTQSHTRSSQVRSGTQRTSSSSQRGRAAAPQRYSDSEILRNRIIAVAALIIMIVIIVSFVSCVAGAIFGGGDKSQESSSNSAAATQTQASSQAAASSSESAASSSQAVVASGSETGVEDPWLSTGYFTTGDEELDNMVKEFCDKHSSPNLSAAENAKKVYEQSVWREYVEDGENQEPVGPNWDIEYAKQSFRKDTANCFEFAACNEFILKYFGYTDVYAEPCFVLMQSGGYGDHGLTFVTDFDGRKCLCDSSLGSNGWLLDADSYTVKLMNVGQDASERNIANFEEVVDAKWLSA